MHIGPQKGLFIIPHSKHSVLYLLHCSRRLHSYYKIKLVFQRLYTGLVAVVHLRTRKKKKAPCAVQITVDDCGDLPPPPPPLPPQLGLPLPVVAVDDPRRGGIWR